MKLTVTAHLGQPGAEPRGAVFPPSGGSLGHLDDNTLVLPDQHGTIAGHHADVYLDAEGWRIKPREGASVAVNGHAVSHGRPWPLQYGDLVEIGPYGLSAGEEYSPWSGLSEPPPVPEPRPSGPHPLQAGVERPHHLDDPLARVEPASDPGDLLQTPLDPLALFRTEAPGSEAQSGAVLDDPLLAGFERIGEPPRRAGFEPSIADAVPEHEGHLRMQIQWPEPEPGLGPVDPPLPPQPPTAKAPRESPPVDRASPQDLILALRQGMGLEADTDWPDPAFMRRLGALLRALRVQLD